MVTGTIPYLLRMYFAFLFDPTVLIKKDHCAKCTEFYLKTYQKCNTVHLKLMRRQCEAIKKYCKMSFRPNKHFK